MAVGLQAWIYKGNNGFDGVDAASAYCLKGLVESHYPGISVSFVSADRLRWKIDSHLQANVSEIKKVVIVFPGGKPSDWDQQLGKTVEKIRDLVIRGARALMVCAGAYFSAAKSVFYLDSNEPIIKNRLLQFFPGCAYGPLYPYGCSVEVCDASGDTCDIYLNLGGYFVPNSRAEEDVDYHVIARYNEPEKKIAIAAVNVGEGVVVMSFPHFEHDMFSLGDVPLNDDVGRMQLINSKLSQTSKEKARLVNTIFEKLAL